MGIRTIAPRLARWSRAAALLAVMLSLLGFRATSAGASPTGVGPCIEVGGGDRQPLGRETPPGAEWLSEASGEESLETDSPGPEPGPLDAVEIGKRAGIALDRRSVQRQMGAAGWLDIRRSTGPPRG